VMANDYPHTLTRVTGSSQGWSGESWSKESLLGGIKLKFRFSNIKVNTDKQLIDGYFESVYDDSQSNIVNLNQTIDDAKDIVLDITSGDEKNTDDNATYTVPFIITDSIAALSTFTSNSTGGGTITFPNGQTLAVDSVPSTIKDTNGNVFQVDKEGKLSQQEELGEPNLEESANLNCGCQNVTFQNIMKGDCNAIIRTLKAIKEAYSTKKKIIVSKLALVKGAISIDSLCIPQLIIWIKDNQTKLNPEKYQITEFQNNNLIIPDTKLWTIKYDDKLEIMIPESAENSEQNIRALAKWLFGGETTTTVSDEIYLPDINKNIQWFSQFNTIFEEPCGCWPINDCNGTEIKSNQCCNRAARKIMESVGISTSNLTVQTIVKRRDGSCPDKCDHSKPHQLYNDDKEVFQQAITNIDYSLKNKLPVMIGVQHPYQSKTANAEWYYKCGSKSNIPRYTNHFMVIVGKGRDSLGEFYWFFEVAAYNQSIGASRENKLRIDFQNNLIQGRVAKQKYPNDNYYIVTQIRFIKK